MGAGAPPSCGPTNLYGPGDSFSLTEGHVIPALIRKAHEARVNEYPAISVWGTGTPRREFLYVDDLADALVFLLKRYSEAETINVGTGLDTSIRELAEEICAMVGFQGALEFDRSKPDGTPRKLSDVSRLTAMGWIARTPLRQGLDRTYAWFTENAGRYRGL